MRLAPFLVVFIVAPFALTMLLNAIKPPYRLLRQNLATRSVLVSNAGAEPRLAAGERRLLVDPATLSRGLANSEYNALIQSFRTVGEIPNDQKRDMLVFLPQSYVQYWHMFDSDQRCTYVGLVVPAITEMAMLDGMPYYGCDVTDQYNMQSYRPRERDQVPADVTDPALCSGVRVRGFRGVIVIEPDSAGAPRRRTIRCAEETVS